MNYKHLNRYDLTPEDDRYNDAWRRVLSRLGDYTGIILRALNMRPEVVSLLDQTTDHVLVRITTPDEYLVLRIAPESTLAGEVYFGRTLARQQLPAARIIQHDLSCAVVPFTYLVESYIGGKCASQVDEPYLLRALARQVGRTLRRMHRVEADGWGRPTPTGCWSTPDWQTVLYNLHMRFAPEPTDMLVFAEAERDAVAGLIEYLGMTCPKPYLMHSAVRPQTTRCTTGEAIQLEALGDPGLVLGGDGLLDLALASDPAYPEAWRIGLIEGYGAFAPLTPAEQDRFQLLQIVSCYWSACWRYMRAEPYEAARDQACALLQQVIETRKWEAS